MLYPFLQTTSSFDPVTYTPQKSASSSHQFEKIPARGRSIKCWESRIVMQFTPWSLENFSQLVSYISKFANELFERSQTKQPRFVSEAKLTLKFGLTPFSRIVSLGLCEVKPDGTRLFLYLVPWSSRQSFSIMIFSDNLTLQGCLLLLKKTMQQSFRELWVEERVWLDVRKKSYLFPPFLRRAPKRFRCFWDARPLNDICYWLSTWLRYRTLANVLYLMRISHFHVRDS